MNFDCMNEMIKYIEENIENDIDMKELSKIANTNSFILSRIFMFLTGMTIIEYIKLRRLSKAFEEIRNTNHKIIDIALKYQYNSASSFNRAFKKQFNISPMECRQKKGNYKIIPIEYFETKKENCNFDYEIERIKSITLFCYHVVADNHVDLLYKIKELYNKIQANGLYEKFNEVGMYGIFSKDYSFHYFLGSTLFYPDLEKYEIKENEYAIFKVISRSQSDIVNLEERINKQWIPSTSYKVENNFKLELYKDDMCYVYLPIK